MSRQQKPKKKLKQSLLHIIRKVFSENQESSLNHKQVCTLIDARENAIRKLTYSVLEDLVKTGSCGSQIKVFARYNKLYELTKNMNECHAFHNNPPDLVGDFQMFCILRPWDLSNPIRVDCSLNLPYKMLQIVGHEPENVFWTLNI